MLLSNAEERDQSTSRVDFIRNTFLKTDSVAEKISKASNPISRNINLSQHAVKTIIANKTTNPEISL